MLIEANYTLLSGDKVLEAGSKKPVLVSAANFDADPPSVVRFAMKPVGFSLSAEQICAEALAVRVAKAAGVKVPNGLVLSLDSEAAKAVSRPSRKVTPGYAFGSQYIDDAILVDQLSDIHPVDAFNIYLFDFLVQNIDRLKYNPNMLLARGGVYAIDHEQCFEFAVRGGAPIASGQLLTSGATFYHTFVDLARQTIAEMGDKQLRHRLLSLAMCLQPSIVNEVRTYCETRIKSKFNWNAVVNHGQDLQQNVDNHVNAFRSAFR